MKKLSLFKNVRSYYGFYKIINAVDIKEVNSGIEDHAYLDRIYVY